MPWLVVVFHTPDQWADAYGDLLSAFGAVAVTESATAGDVVLEPAPGATPRWATTAIEALFELGTDIGCVARALEEFARRHRAPMPRPDIRFVAERDFTSLSPRREPRRFGRRLWVIPTDHAPAAGEDVWLRLDPGLAFGTGDHPTTALCLEWLDANPPTDACVVDFGCGSGILGIAAALLGAQHVLAVDHDPQALIATRSNARINGVHERVVALAAAAAPPPGEDQYDVVLANILANPLIELAPLFARLVRPGGKLVLSGILESQVDAVCAAQHGVAFHTPVTTDGWALIAGTMRDG